ncbi:MAG: LysM peptidoglycan-binding domain-containing protein [Candidatus Omnitrophota bacterium]
MRKTIFMMITVFLSTGMMTGCSATRQQQTPQAGVKKGGLEVQMYAEEKPRLDQSMEKGNFGYISGQPQAPDRSDIKKTRKIYVVEVTKNVDRPEEVEDLQLQPIPDVEPVRVPPKSKPEPKPKWTEPVKVEEPLPDMDKELTYEEYTVQEGDTLQKISKKYYDTYQKWIMIYEENKDVLPNPDRISPGMTIKIPVYK